MNLRRIRPLLMVAGPDLTGAPAQGGGGGQAKCGISASGFRNYALQGCFCTAEEALQAPHCNSTLAAYATLSPTCTRSRGSCFLDWMGLSVSP